MWKILQHIVGRDLSVLSQGFDGWTDLRTVASRHVKHVFAVCVFLGALPLFAAINECPQIGDVRLRGPYADKLERLLEHQVRKTDATYLARPFRQRCPKAGNWATEFWGKFMHSAVPFAAYEPNAEFSANIDRGVDLILSAQEPSGYIGNYADDVRLGGGWDVWGIKYTMLGLIHYYDGMKSGPRAEKGAKALEACKRLCDYVIAELGPGGRRGRELWQTGEWSGMPSCSILEPVVWLYRRTHERRYLEFADHVVRQMSEPVEGPRLVDLALKGVPVSEHNGFGAKPDKEGGYVMRRNRRKAYEMMSCYQGLVEYWEVKSEEGVAPGADVDKFLKAAVAAGESILNDEITLAGSGASSEIWYRGAARQHLPFMSLQETCVTTTWMRFAEKLLTVTGDPRWADALERTFYNAYLAAINPESTEFSSYTQLDGYRWRGGDSCQMHLNCCSMNGPRGFLAFLRSVVQARGEHVFYNFYTSGSQRIAVPSTGQVAEFDSFTYYPRTEKVTINYTGRENASFVLSLRIPAWSVKTKVLVNGRDAGTPKPGAYFDLRRDWRNGDTVSLTLDLSAVSHVQDHHVAFTRGPILLARDSRFGDGLLSERIPLSRWAFEKPLLFETPRFEPVQCPTRDMDMAFVATMRMGAHQKAVRRDVHFCDFASAGNRWTPTCTYQTWLPLERNPTEAFQPASAGATATDGKETAR